MRDSDFFQQIAHVEVPWGDRTISVPLFYYDVSAIGVAFLTPLDKIRSLLPCARMHPLRVTPRHGLTTINAYQYGDCDLGPYNEVAIGFPITIDKISPMFTGSLHIYNITHDFWYTETTPVWYPAEGRWGQEIVSLLNTPGVSQNVCYLSGGATQPGGGQTRDLWVYYPANPGAGSHLGNFPDSHPFNFHASWYVPWLGTQGSICVAGGIDFNSQIDDATQCYDLATSSFRTPNADLGTLPEPWWGMADGWQMYQGQYQIWMANGVAQDGSLLPISVYASATSGGFQPGPEVPVALYRGEGDGWVDSFYMVGGSMGGFSPSHYNQLFARCPWCAEIHLPVILRNHTN